MDPEFAVYIRLAAVTGARPGEICGLRWADVGWDTGEIIVRRRVSRTESAPVQRMTTGDLVDEFQAGLDADLAADPPARRSPRRRRRRLTAPPREPGGQLSQRLGLLPVEDLGVVRHPHPEVLQILDPRPLLDDAARLAARYGGGLLIAESLAAALTHGRSLWFGIDRNVGRVLAYAAADPRHHHQRPRRLKDGGPAAPADDKRRSAAGWGATHSL